MLQHNQNCWKSHRGKLIICFLIAVVIIQYFSASVYSIKIFDYRVMQSFYFNDGGGKKGNGASSNSELIVEEHPVPENTTEMLPKNEEENAAMKSEENNEPAKIIVAQEVSAGVKAETESTVADDKTNLSSVPQNFSSSQLPICPVVPPVLVGPIKVWFDKPGWKELEKLYADTEPGGFSKPKDCISRHRVAMVIPYRDRDEHLRIFLHNLHSLLRKQQLEFAIYVVEQMANQTFNRAKLMNVGFAEAIKQFDWQCFIFHDVDLLPEDDRNIYSCPQQPRHMSVAVDKFKYRLPYNDIFGGITALTTDQFRSMNGYSNSFWGWGGEDDEIASRVKILNYKISRYPANIGRYKMIKHTHEDANPINKCRYNLMYKVKNRWKNDGLSSLNYKVLKIEFRSLFTWILVDLLENESKRALVQEQICKGAT